MGRKRIKDADVNIEKIELEKEVVRRVCFMVYSRIRVKKPMLVFETEERSVYWIIGYGNIDLIDIIANTVKEKKNPRWIAKVLPAFFEGNDCLYIDAEIFVGNGTTLKELYDVVDLGDRLEFDKLDVIPTKIETTNMRWVF